MNSYAPRRRPGGRTADVTKRIHEAILELIVEQGVEACSFSNVAERAGVERSTLYRRYPDRWPAIIAAVLERTAEDAGPTLTGSFAGDLKAVLVRIAGILTSPLGPAVMSASAAMHAEGGTSEIGDYYDERIVQLAPIFGAAVARGELPANVDREELFTFASGALWFRRFVSSRPIDEPAIDAIVASVCRHYCLPAGQRDLP